MNESPDTRTRLLAAARELFASQGFDNTSIRQITSRAEANLGAVTYHFQSKEHLYLSVLESLTEPLYRRVVEAVAPPSTPLDRIESFVRVYFDYLLANPQLPSLVLHAISHDRPLPGAVRTLMERVFGLLTEVIGEGQREGKLAGGDIGLLSMSVIALPVHTAVIARRVAQQVLGRDLDEPAARAQVIDHIVGFLRRALAKSEKRQ